MDSVFETIVGLKSGLLAFLFGLVYGFGNSNNTITEGSKDDSSEDAIIETVSVDTDTLELTEKQLKFNDLFQTLVNTLKVETYNFDTLITALVKVREGYSIRQLSGIPKIGFGFVSGCVRDWSAKIGKAKLVEYANELYSLDSVFMLGVARDFIPHLTKDEREWNKTICKNINDVCENEHQELDYTMSKTENEMMHEYLQRDYEEAVKRGDFDEPERTIYGLEKGVRDNFDWKYSADGKSILRKGIDYDIETPSKEGDSEIVFTNLWDFQDGSPLNSK